jgi:DnaJ-class molecular chaperone
MPGPNEPTLYHVLGVPVGSSVEVAKAAFRRKAKLTHPDLQKGQGTEATVKEFHDISEAIRVLGDPLLKASYDQKLSASPSGVTYEWHREGGVSQTSAKQTNSMDEPFFAQHQAYQQFDAERERPDAIYYRKVTSAYRPKNEAERLQRVKAREVRPLKSSVVGARIFVPLILGVTMFGTAA